MAGSNVERVLSGFVAFNGRDVEAFIEHFNPDLVWHFNPGFAGNEGRVLRGRQNLRGYMENDIDGVWRTFRAEPRAIYDLGDVALVVVHLDGAGFASGVRVDMTIYDVFQYDDDGLVVRRISHLDREEAVAAIERMGGLLREPHWAAA